MRACAVAGLVAGVMLAPWAIRKQHALGAPIATSTNGGFNLLMGSYREGRYAPMEEGIDCPEGLGEFEADRCRLARASARIAARPGDAIARSLLRLEHTFGHESAAAEVWATSIEAREPTQASARLWALGIARPTWHLLVLGGIAGAVVLALRRRRSAGPCGRRARRAGGADRGDGAAARGGDRRRSVPRAVRPDDRGARGGRGRGGGAGVGRRVGHVRECERAIAGAGSGGGSRSPSPQPSPLS